MINQNLVNKIHSFLDKGVTPGLSKDPKPGSMCLEQIVSYALEEEINDKPSCVGKQVRWFVVSLNDCDWSSPSARAEGIRDLAIAQLGSDSLNQDEFRDKLRFAVITKLLPSMFRDLGEEKWEKEIKSLEKVKVLEEARKAARDALSNINYYNSPYTDCNFINYAADVTKTGDKYFKMAAHLVIEVLKDMKSSGCQFLN